MGTDREWGQSSTPVLPTDRSPAEFQTFLGLRIAAEVTRKIAGSACHFDRMRSFQSLREGRKRLTLGCRACMAWAMASPAGSAS